MACAAAVAAHVLTRLIWPVVEPIQSPLSFAAVVVSAWYGGLGPGLLTTALTLLGKIYFFVAPMYSFRVEGTLAAVHLGLFAAVAFLVSSLTGALRRAEAESRAARAEAEATNRAQDLFLAAISHELRTPLQAMGTWLHLLRRRARDEVHAADAMDALARSVAAQSRLIDDLLDRSRIVASKIELALEPVDLAAVIEAAVVTARAAAPGPAPVVHTRLDPTTGPVIGDPARLEQVVCNLVSNAIKFTPTTGEIVVRLEHDASRARVVVADNGRGMPRELVPHVFDAFRQARASGAGASAGVGLGLAIVRHLVELHGGAVRAQSDGPGRGATFVVDLPLADQRTPAALTRPRGAGTPSRR
ncbi:MAG: DUF4118 domain-containing protein [Candidatus Rokubacteria bacterium]|nr:DUF4118 domain-containing protein [Candidatus Rokubacteria bacterium]